MPKRILVVDDAEAILFAFSRLLGRCGFGVDCARELEEAEALLAHTSYDVVICDLSLTAGDGREGLEILRFLRCNCPGVRIILLTGYASPQIRREALDRGADAFVEKTRPMADIARLAHELSGGCA